MFGSAIQGISNVIAPSAIVVISPHYDGARNRLLMVSS